MKKETEAIPRTEENRAKKLITIFLVMFRIGLFTFGGGLVMIPQMSRDFVKKYGWIKEEEIVDFFSVAQSLPGVIAVNASIMIGYKLVGVVGGLVAALGAVLPSFLVLMGVTLIYEAFITNVIVLGVLRGVRSAVVALLFYTALKLRKGALLDVFCWAVFIVASVLALFTEINVVFILLGGALLGVIVTLCFPVLRGKGARK